MKVHPEQPEHHDSPEPREVVDQLPGALIATMVQTYQDDAGSRWALLGVGMDMLKRFANSHYHFFPLEHPEVPHGTPISFQN